MDNRIGTWLTREGSRAIVLVEWDSACPLKGFIIKGPAILHGSWHADGRWTRVDEHENDLMTKLSNSTEIKPQAGRPWSMGEAIEKIEAGLFIKHKSNPARGFEVYGWDSNLQAVFVSGIDDPVPLQVLYNDYETSRGDACGHEG